MKCVNRRACAMIAAWVYAAVPSVGYGDDCPPPLNVSATETVDCIPVDVYWDIVSAFEYNIWRAPIDRPLDAELIGTTNYPPFTDYSGPIGEQVLYWVSAVAECGESERAGPDFGYRAGGGAPPPAWISASDGEYCNSVLVDWDTSSGAADYTVYRNNSPDLGSAMVIGSGTPPFYDYGVSGADVYYYWVGSMVSCGQYGYSPFDMGYGLSGATFILQPQSQTVMVNDSVMLYCDVSGGSSCIWTKDQAQVFENERISGAFTFNLSISPVLPEDAGYYQCIVYGTCGGETGSDIVYLTVDVPPCPADFNQDGGIDGADVEAFFVAWEGGDSAADVNADGGIDGADVETFFIAWEAGGCA